MACRSDYKTKANLFLNDKGEAVERLLFGVHFFDGKVYEQH